MSRGRLPPLVTGISPNEGVGWTKVTIRGENLGTGPADLIGLSICGHNCLLTAEWMSASKIVCRVGPAKNDKGEIIVTTKSGGDGTSTVSFKLLKPEKIEAVPQKDLEGLFKTMSGGFTSENFSATWYLIENHSATRFDQLKTAANNLRKQANKKNEGSLAYVKGGLSTFFEAQDALSGASVTADTLFQEVLGRKDKADSTRNALSVLQRFKFLFNLPLNIERNIQKGDYDVVINDYEKAKSLFGNTEVQVFKKGWRFKGPQQVTFVENPTEVVISQLPNFWKLWISYVNGSLFSEPSQFEHCIVQTLESLKEPMECKPGEVNIFQQERTQDQVCELCVGIMKVFINCLEQLSTKTDGDVDTSHLSSDIASSDLFSNIHEDFCPTPEQRLLIILSNCQYLEKHTFINLAEHFEKHSFHGTEKITRILRAQLLGSAAQDQDTRFSCGCLQSHPQYLAAVLVTAFASPLRRLLVSRNKQASLSLVCGGYKHRLTQEDILFITGSEEGDDLESDSTSTAVKLSLSAELPLLIKRTTAVLQVPWPTEGKTRQSIFEGELTASPVSPLFTWIFFLRSSRPWVIRSMDILYRVHDAEKLDLAHFPLVEASIAALVQVPNLTLLSKDATCPNKQCWVLEVILKCAYAASVFAARLGNYNIILVAYQSHFQSHRPCPQQLDEPFIEPSGVLVLVHHGHLGAYYSSDQLLAKVQARSFWVINVTSVTDPQDAAVVSQEVSVESVRDLDQRQFETYIELKADPIVGSLEPGIYAGYFDWKDCLPPQVANFFNCVTQSFHLLPEYDLDSFHLLPECDLDSFQLLPECDLDSFQLLPACDLDSFHLLPECDLDSFHLHPECDLDSFHLLPECDLDSFHLLPECDLDSFQLLPECDLDSFQLLPECDLDSFHLLPECDLDSFHLLPECDLDSFQLLPECDLDSFHLLPECDLDSFRLLPECDLGSFHLLPECDLGSFHLLPESPFTCFLNLLSLAS
ncbi:UNVERIFIED_CONTAM: hypothetical protein FKN15_017237 [Acipenser sinensis]